MARTPVTCGDANPNGNITFRFRGSCGGTVSLEDAYRCTGCGGRFHRACIFKHFEQEKGCSVAHKALADIRKIVGSGSGPLSAALAQDILDICMRGLDTTPQKVSFIP